MSENENVNVTESLNENVNSNSNMAVNVKKTVSVSLVMKGLALLAMILCFCPTFLVSCSGEKVNINVISGAFGVKAFGERVSGRPILIILILIPMAILGLLFVKKINEKKLAIGFAAGTVVDTAFWIYFRKTVESIAKENYCEFKTTVWYYINFMILMMLIIMNVMIISGVFQFNGAFLITKTRYAAGMIHNNVNTPAVETVAASSETTGVQAESLDNNADTRVCAKCGKPLPAGAKFCGYCGTKV